MSPFKWIHSLVIAAAASVAVMGGLTSAQAATVVFDFADMAADNESEFDNNASYATVDGITIQVEASGNDYSKPYLDDLFNSRPGGLGVCSSGFNTSSGECSVPSDDNVSLTSSGAEEMLTLMFFSDTAATNQIEVTLDLTFFRDEIHKTDFPKVARIEIGIDGVFQLYMLVADFTTQLTGMTFDFKYFNEEFYIESLTAIQDLTVSVVPLPAALPLFASALAALGFFGWRRRKVA